MYDIVYTYGIVCHVQIILTRDRHTKNWPQVIAIKNIYRNVIQTGLYDMSVD